MDLINIENNRGLEIVNEILSHLNSESNFILSNKFLDKKVVSVFRNEDLIHSAQSFFDNDLNISETSKNTFMHRNTLVYRIEKIYKITGLNIRKFNDAVCFLVLKSIFDKTNNVR